MSVILGLAKVHTSAISANQHRELQDKKDQMQRLTRLVVQAHNPFQADLMRLLVMLQSFPIQPIQPIIPVFQVPFH